jgi:hypothetical protein
MGSLNLTCSDSANAATLVTYVIQRDCAHPPNNKLYILQRPHTLVADIARSLPLDYEI